MTHSTNPGPTRFRGALALAMGLVLGMSSGLSGQSLHLAELFAKQGREADARAEVLAWFEIREDDATPEELQQGLWLRGRFAPDPAAAAEDFQRLLAEFPSGSYAALAAEALAERAVADGDTRAAIRLYSGIVKDHPDSPPASDARAWLSAQGVRIEPPPTPPVDSTSPALRRPAGVVPAAVPRVTAPDSAPPPAMPDSTPPPVVRDSVKPAPPVVRDSVKPAPPVVRDSVQPPPPAARDSVKPSPPAARDSVALAPPPVQDLMPPPSAQADSVGAPPPATEPPEPIPHGPAVPGAQAGGAFAVQIGAYRNPDGPRRLVADLVAAGYDARLVQVPMNDLLRVRVGRFATLADAGATLARLIAAGYQGAVVNDARVETVVR